MMILTVMGLTSDSLVRTIFALFLCVSMIQLVVLVFWGLAFLYQQEASPNVKFFSLACSHQ